MRKKDGTQKIVMIAISDPGPRLYRWGSYGEYLQRSSLRGIAVDQGLKLWGAQRSQAIKAYRRFVREGLERGYQGEYYEVKEQRSLGGDEFVEVVHRTIDDQEESRAVKITMAEGGPRNRAGGASSWRISVHGCDRGNGANFK